MTAVMTTGSLRGNHGTSQNDERKCCKNQMTNLHKPLPNVIRSITERSDKLSVLSTVRGKT
jgi:hypothetical protein